MRVLGLSFSMQDGWDVHDTHVAQCQVSVCILPLLYLHAGWMDGNEPRIWPPHRTHLQTNNHHVQLLDRMEEVLAAGQQGFVADYHSCELFPER